MYPCNHDRLRPSTPDHYIIATRTRLMRITERSVRALAVPANGQAIYFDDDVKGFGVRVTSAGCRSWIVEVRRGSRSQRMTIGRIVELPAAEARSRAIDIKRGGIVRRERHRATIEDAWSHTLPIGVARSLPPPGGALRAECVFMFCPQWRM
jgi:hypothetical protein